MQSLHSHNRNFSFLSDTKNTYFKTQLCRNKVISPQTLITLFEAARRASSFQNQQPWHYLYAHQNHTSYNQLFSCLNNVDKSWAGQAPILILCCYKTHTQKGKANFFAKYDLYKSISRMEEQANRLGLFLCLMDSPLIQNSERVFNLPAYIKAATIMAVGYSASNERALRISKERNLENSNKVIRRFIHQFVHQNFW